MKTLFKSIRALLPVGDGFECKICDIAVDGKTIFSISEDAERDGFKPDKTIDGRDKLICAGLVNSHTHSYMSLFRNSADDLMFHDWLFGRIMPMEDRLTPDDIYYGTQLACLEMIKTGTTAFLDMNICRDATTRAITESGLKAAISRGLVGNGRNDESGIRRIEDTLYDMEAYGGNPRLRFMFGPHAVYTTDREYLELIMDKAAQYGLDINVHLSESVKEVEDCKAQHGISPVEYLENIGMFKFHTVAAHCVQLSDKDIEILAKNKVFVVTNPISNAKLGNGFARIPDMIEKGVNICIGTDSAASNNTLNMFSDLNFICLAHKGATGTAQAVSAQQALKFATENGAAALGFNNTGVLKEGMAADLIVMDMKYPSMQPPNNLVAAMCYSASGYEVESVMVDGEFLMENRIIPHLDEERIYFECEKAMKRIDA